MRELTFAKRLDKAVSAPRSYAGSRISPVLYSRFAKSQFEHKFVDSLFMLVKVDGCVRKVTFAKRLDKADSAPRSYAGFRVSPVLLRERVYFELCEIVGQV